MRLGRLVVLVILLIGGTLPKLSHAQTDSRVEFPAPSGPYAVGRVDYEWVDETRPEAFTDDPADVRDLMITVYYPAEVPADAVPAPYISNELGSGFGLSPSVIEQLHTHVYSDVPAVNEVFPVLIFSPGMGLLPVFYSSLLIEMTSQGYVVVVLWHPYSTALTPFPDGRVVTVNKAGSPSLSEDPEAEKDRVGAVWVADMRFVLDQLPQLNTDDALLVGRLDLERIGAFGHSFGGATSVQAAYEDERLDAAINMDGAMFGDVRQQGSRVPLLMLQSPPPAEAPSSLELAVAGITLEEYEAITAANYQSIEDILAMSANATRHMLDGSAHNTYTPDFLILAPVLPGMLSPSQVGTIDPLDAYQQIVTWVSDFMATYVKGS